MIVPVMSSTHLHLNFKDGFRAGQRIVVGGLSGDSRFEINFYTATDIAMHVNARQGEGEIVMNTKSEGEWGDEERIDCSFGSGDTFEISICCHDGEYQIEVIGGCNHSYAHRLPTEDVMYMQVEGDMRLNKVLLDNE